MEWKCLKNFGENRLYFVEKFKLIKIWWIISIGHRNLRKVLTIFCEFGPKMKKKIQEKFEIFWSKSLWKIDFFHNFLLHIYWISASSPKVYTPLEAYFDTVRACLGVAAWGFRGRTPRTLEKFSKMLSKISTENNNFRPIFHNFNENFPLKCLEFLAKLWEKLRSMRL